MVQLARDLFSLQNEARIDPSGFVSRLRDEALFDAADALENASPRACSAFTRSNGLDQAALEHSDVLAQTGAQSHTVGTSTFFGRIEKYGSWSTTIGENIAFGRDTAFTVLGGLINSPGHRENIYNCDFTLVGIACQDGHPRFR
ncbi:MAG: hypothetical protein SGCHY_000547 [Lobulomycetales sp.]